MYRFYKSIQPIKVHIFWESNKILRNLHCRFYWHYLGQIYGGYFAKLNFNTEHATDSYFVSVLKMEHGCIFWLKVSFSLIIKYKYHYIFFWNIPSCAKPFSDPLIYFIVRILVQKYKFSNKNDLLCAWRDFEKKSLWDL